MIKNYTILYAEDDETLAFLTKDSLEMNHFNVVHCAHGNDVIEAFNNNTIHLCLFDIMLPGLDGFELTTAIRKINAEVPILFLSAKTLKEDRIKGLKIGADDYLIKPFSIEELLLKIDIFLTRAKKITHANSAFSIGNIWFDAPGYTLICNHQKITLTQREAALLELLYQHKNQVITRENILKQLWGENDYFMGRSLDVFISRLRKILTIDPSIQIENLHSIGFRLSIKNETL
ncbi:MAG: response regulator transcription factor [Ferruginibacter sp.]